MTNGIQTLILGQLPSSINPSILQIKVTPLLDKTSNGVVLRIDWDKKVGAKKYNVFASPTPTQRNFYLSTTDNFIEFSTDITVPNDIVFHFWVEADYGNGVKRFIQDTPAFIAENDAFDKPALSPDIEDNYMLDNGDMKDKVQEIRNRALAILQNDGEPFFLYIRRWEGLPCATCRTSGTGFDGGGVGTPIDFKTKRPLANVIRATDPDFNANYQCVDCGGTGIQGGYFPKISILARYGEMPIRTIRRTRLGLDLGSEFNSWTFAFPILREHDILVCQRTGERYRVKDPARARWRGIVTFQKFNAIYIAQTDVAYKITDESILTGFTLGSTFDTAEYNWSVWA